ncbi:MAG: reverse transcriptase domain-containing protein, partial [Pseudomonadota bacterium]
VSFLSNRFQRVCLDGNVSDWSAVTSGVPQGSVLGPLLFCLVVDSLSPIFPNSSILKYADDVIILHFIRKSEDDKLQAEWNALVDWSETISLPINYSKSQVLDIVTKSRLSLAPVSVSSTVFLKNVNFIVFLGVVISDDLKWNSHFDRMLKRAAKRTFILRNLRRSGCPQNIMWRVYLSMIRPLLTYAVPSFCNAPVYLFESLLRFERRLCRIMGIEPADHPSVVDFMNLSCEKLFIQIHNNVNHSMRSLFLPHSSSRSMLQLRPPFARTKRFKSSFIRYCKSTRK